MEIGKRIELARTRIGMNKITLASKAGLSRTTIDQIEKGLRKPHAATVRKIADALDVDVLELWDEGRPVVRRPAGRLPLPNDGRPLLGADRDGATVTALDSPSGELVKVSGQVRRVPVFDIEGGYNLDFDDGGYPVGQAGDYALVPDITDPNAFAACLHGDSMRPEFVDGEILTFSCMADIKSGDYALVRHRDHGATFKQVFLEGPFVRLRPLNPSYPELTWRQDELVTMARLVQKSKRY